MDPKNTMWIDSKHAFILTDNKSLRFEYHLESTLELNTDRLGSHISLASDWLVAFSVEELSSKSNSSS